VTLTRQTFLKVFYKALLISRLGMRSRLFNCSRRFFLGETQSEKHTLGDHARPSDAAPAMNEDVLAALDILTNFLYQ